MAKTFYGYVDRRGANQVDWEGIATQASDSLKTVAADREAKKKELDEVNRSLVSATNDIELGQNQTFNQFIMDGANQSKQALLMYNKLLKKGLITPNDYSSVMQTIGDDWKSFEQSTKKFNEVYDEAFKRLNDGTMAAEEVFKKENLFQFGNVQNKGMYVNPVDGRMYIAERDEKGRLITDPEKLVNVASLNNMMNEKVEKFDLIGNVSKGAEKVANIINVIRKNGVLTLDDARQNPLYKKAKEDFISALLANPKNAASILADSLGGYEFTYDKSKAGGNVILLEKDGSGIGQPKLTKEQEKIARETLDAAFEVQIQQKETPMPVFAPQTPRGGSGQDDDMIFSYGNALEIAAGTPNAQGLVQAISRNPNSIVSNIVATPSQIVIEFKDGRAPERINRIGANGAPMPVDQIAQAIFPYLDPRATPAKTADVAGKFRSQFGLPSVQQPGSFGEMTYRSIDQLSTVANVNGTLTPTTVRTAILSIDPESETAFANVGEIARKINPNIQVSPSSREGYIEIAYPGVKSKGFPLKSAQSLARISEYLENLNNFIFKKQQAQPASTAPPATAGGLMSKY